MLTVSAWLIARPPASATWRMALKTASLSQGSIGRIPGFPSVSKDGSFRSMQPCRFVLQAIDPAYGHPAFETMFVVHQPEDLQALLGPIAADDAAFDRSYTLAPLEVVEITARFGVAFDPEGRATRL